MKIHYNFLVCKAYHETRTRPLVEIVGKDILDAGDEYTLIGGYPSFDDLPILQLTRDDSYFSCIHKLLNCMLWHDENETEFDWFFIGDDDTFINVKEFVHYTKALLTERLEIHGRLLVNYFEDATYLYNKDETFFAAYGGTGIWLNRKTFKTLIPTIKKYVRYVTDNSFSDISLGLYVHLYNSDKTIDKKIHFSRRAGERLYSATDSIHALLPEHRNMLCFHTKDVFSIAELKKFVEPSWEYIKPTYRINLEKVIKEERIRRLKT